MSLLGVLAGKDAYEAQNSAARVIQNEFRKFVKRRELQDEIKHELEEDNVVIVPSKVLSRLEEESRSAKGYGQLLLYLCFLCVFFAAVIMQRNASAVLDADKDFRRLIESIEGNGRGYRDLRNYDDVYAWIEDLVNEIGDVTYNENGDPEKHVFDRYTLFSPVTLTQVRRHLETCPGSEKFNFLQDTCLTETESREFYDWMKGDTTLLESIYDPLAIICSTDTVCLNYDQMTGQSYAFGFDGFVIPILAHGLPLATNLEVLEYIRKSEWLDRAVWTLEAKLVVLNRDLLDQWTVIKTLFTFEAGRISGKLTIPSARSRLFEVTSDYVRLVTEIATTFGVVLFWMEELWEIMTYFFKHKSLWGYFTVWNVIDVTTLGLISSLIITYTTIVSRVESEPLPTSSRPVEIQRWIPHVTLVADQFSSYFSMMSFAIFLSFIRLFKYLKFQRRLSLLTDTVKKAMTDLIHFLVMVTFVFVSFMLMAHINFGIYSEMFVTLSNSFATLFRWTNGEFESLAFIRDQTAFADFFFLWFELTVVFVLVNMFLAIIFEAHAHVKPLSADSAPVWTDIGRIVRRMCRKDRIPPDSLSKLRTELNTRKSRKDKPVTKREVRHSTGISQKQVDAFFQSYSSPEALSDNDVLMQVMRTLMYNQLAGKGENLVLRQALETMSKDLAAVKAAIVPPDAQPRALPRTKTAAEHAVDAFAESRAAKSDGAGEEIRPNRSAPLRPLERRSTNNSLAGDGPAWKQRSQYVSNVEDKDSIIPGYVSQSGL